MVEDKVTPEQLEALLSKKETDNLVPELKELWQQCRQFYKERLFFIQKAVTVLNEGELTPQQQHEAEREAHTLIGSLGSFGLDKASDISRQIKQILQQEKPLGKIHAEELELLLTQLQYYFELDDSTTSHTVSYQLLIIDNHTVLARQIAKEGLIWGFIAQIATHLEQAQQILADSAVDIILLDLNFQNDIKIGLDFLAKIRSDNPDISVVILTQEDSFTLRIEVARLGIPCFLQKPIATEQVLTSLRQVLTKQRLSLYKLLVVDDDPALLQLIYKILSPYGYQITLLAQPEKFWETLEQTNPDLLILDVEFDNIDKPKHIKQLPLNGFDLCQIVRSDVRWNRLPILFLSAHTDVETIQHGFVIGANDFLTKPIVVTELQTRVRTRLEQQTIWKDTEVDALTGVSQRRKTLQDLTRLIQQSQRQQQPFCLAVLDLDLFKRINDKYGHHTGDRVLRYLGKLLNQSFRLEDVIGRWGGEEFVVGMYGTTGQLSIERLTQVKEKFQQHFFTTDGEDLFQVTFSAGIAQFPYHGNDVQKLFQVADIALYQAKKQGRNRIVLAADILHHSQ